MNENFLKGIVMVRCIIFAIAVLFVSASVGRAQITWSISLDTPFYIILPEGQTPNKIDFEDFIAFAQAYNSQQGDPHYNYRADTNQDGVVNFPDFIAFAGQFGLVGTPLDIGPPPPPLHSISGRALVDSIGLSGVYVYLNDDKAYRAITDGSGYFYVDRLEAGIYKMRLEKQGFVVTPDTLQIEITDANITELNFVVRSLQYMISGTVVDSTSGTGLADVQIVVQGNSQLEGVTDSVGYFVFKDLPYRSYYIEPKKEGFIFTPQFFSIEFTDGDTSAVQNFQARQLTALELGQTIALDLDLDSGYQAVHQKVPPGVGEKFKLDIAVLGGAMGTNGFSFALEYDEELLRWGGFERKDLYSRALVLPSTDASVLSRDGRKFVKTSLSMAILGGVVEADSGSAGHITLEVLKPFSKTQVYLSNARFNYLEGGTVIIPLTPENVMVSLDIE